MSDKPEWRCKTCKWKQENEPETSWLPNTCKRIKGPQDYGESDFVLDEELAFSSDASGYRSDLEVTDDFGCILWEPKSE